MAAMPSQASSTSSINGRNRAIRLLPPDQSGPLVKQSLTYQETRSVKNVDCVKSGSGSKHIYTAVAIGLVAVAVIAVALLLKNRG